MLWKTIDVKAAARSDDVRNCETSQLQIPCFSEFSSEFFAHEARKPPIVPKIREISSALRELSRDSREFRANPPARLELQVLSLESEYR